MSLPTMYAARKNLVDIGAVTVEERRSKAGDQSSNLYWVHWDQPDDGVKKVTHPPVKFLDTPLTRNLDPNTDKTKTDTQTPVQKPVTPADDEGFAEFWKVYPRKAGKGAARQAWAKAIQTTDRDTIIAGAERYRDDPNRETAYTAHPSTWLNHERWDDDPLPKRDNMETPRAATYMEQVTGEPCEHGEPRGSNACPLCRSNP